MPLNLASPGIVVREVDLTSGRVDPTSDKSGGLVAPFAKGPVEIPTLVETEADLLNNFGEPYGANNQYEYWYTASSYLAYGGVLRVVRSDNAGLQNAYVGSGSSIKIKSNDDYVNNGYDTNIIAGKTFVAKNPGSWSNGLKVAIIDGRADQTLSGITTTGSITFTEAISNRSATIATGAATTVGITTTSIALNQVVRGNFVSAGTTVTSIGNNSITLSAALTNNEGGITVPLDFGSNTVNATPFEVGMGVTQRVPANTVVPGAGSTSVLDGYFKGIITEIGNSSIDVKFVAHVSAAGIVSAKDYTPGGTYRFANSGDGSNTDTALYVYNSSDSSEVGLSTYTAQVDWFDQQEIELTSGNVKWNRLVERPTTTSYASARGSRNDELHVVVYDDLGTVSGNAGTLLEKHLSLSKATDAQFSAGSDQYWRGWLQFNSDNLFGGGAPSGVTTTGFAAGVGATTFTNFGDGGWDQKASDITFNAYGNQTLSLSGGKDYGGTTGITTTGGLLVNVGDLSSGYDLFENPDTFDIDFVLMGSGAHGKEETQAIASKIIALAEERQDAVAFVSPYRQAFLSDGASVSLNNSSTITDNLVSYFSAIPSSSYAVFDSSYKYTYDRFADTFRYVPLNGDIAGICARNDINNFPWFSPAGTQRGSILNAVKLAYNPTKSQRDVLYSNRVNPVIFSPGSGIVLFGDKTGLARASAFDRINVRRLFIYLERAISAAARDQMFEFNDEITRTNFVSIVEPFLRDVQAKRGITDFVVKCDETNNTAAVIDNNEFVADIYIKPARSINFIGLTFVATRTGVSFEEVLGV